MGGETMNIYHGSTEVIEKPRYDLGRPNLDFGFGFYATDILQQAIDWAQRVADKRQLTPIINIYDFDRETTLANYKCKIFTAYDGEWLDFILDSRLGRKPWQCYDYVEGGIANDRVIDTIDLYMADLITRDKALERLSGHRPNNQMCFLNQEIIDTQIVYVGTK